VWLVYLLQCGDGTIYTGITNNLENRVKKHNSGKGAKYTRSRLPVILLVSKEIGTKSEAAKEEYRIKKLKRIDKLNLVKCWLKS